MFWFVYLHAPIHLPPAWAVAGGTDIPRFQIPLYWPVCLLIALVAMATPLILNYKTALLNSNPKTCISTQLINSTNAFSGASPRPQGPLRGVTSPPRGPIGYQTIPTPMPPPRLIYRVRMSHYARLTFIDTNNAPNPINPEIVQFYPIRRIVFLRASPQTPWVGFAELWVWDSLLRSRTNAFCFFFWKKKRLA
jgi:hypothetical protein